MDSTKPVKTFRDGSVAASIWLRQTKVGVFYDVTFSRAWKDDAGKTGYSPSFSDRHLNTLVKVALEARAWITHKKANAETVSIGDGTGDVSIE